MPELDIFATIYGKAGLFGLLCLVVWKVYHDMKGDKHALLFKIETVEKRHETYCAIDHERVITTLQDNARSREKLTEAIIKMSQATERLPCNQSQPVDKRWVTPAHGTSTPPKGNQQ